MPSDYFPLESNEMPFFVEGPKRFHQKLLHIQSKQDHHHHDTHHHHHHHSYPDHQNKAPPQVFALFSALAKATTSTGSAYANPAGRAKSATSGFRMMIEFN